MTSRRRVGLLAGLLGALAAVPAASQSPDSTAPRIAIITVGPGPLVWEMFGHNMIRVTYPPDGPDLAYNFGIFDFNQEHFYWNFLQGRMLYSTEDSDAAYELRRYRRTGRSIEIQDLDLTPDEARLLAANLARSALPEFKDYRYDYYLDNCSTRVRDAVNASLAGALERHLAEIPTQSTFRSRTAELVAGSPAVYFGLMLMLGPSTDRPLSAWQESFVPMDFARYLSGMTVRGEGRAGVPLVTVSSLEPARGPMARPVPAPSSWLPWFLALGVLLGGALAWAGARSGASRGHGAFLVLGAAWALVTGIAGFAMLYLWAFTDHAVAYRNENMLQASVLGLVIFGMLARWARRRAPLPPGVATVAGVVAVLSVVGVVLQLLPWFDQVNGDALVFFVPANLGMALGARRAAGSATTGPS